jgi:hypothetical protein
VEHRIFAVPSARFILRRAKLLAFVALAFVALGTSRTLAGPPFVTDDPEPTDYRHWEIYTGFQYENDGSGNSSASLPFAEFNYGAMPNVQVSISGQPNAVNTGIAGRSGYGVTEFGIKTRFVQESDDRPQVSFYPSVQTPVVAGAHAVTLLPVWLQKSSGPWTAFGGGGVYLDSSPGMRDSTFVGGALERSISPGTTVGAELYHQSADMIGGTDTTAANLGMIAQVGKYHAILFSAGRALHGDDTFFAYASYEFALGPERR